MVRQSFVHAAKGWNQKQLTEDRTSTIYTDCNYSYIYQTLINLDRCTYCLVLSCVLRKMVNMNQTIKRTQVFLLFRDL